MRRKQSVEPWEVEARERAEALRQGLDDLTGLGRAVADGSLDVRGFLKSFDAKVANATGMRDWLSRWTHKTAGRVSSQAEPAHAVYSSCLPVLADSIELFARAIAVLVISPDPSALRDGDTETDGAIAADGLRLSQELATAALSLIQEAPTLKKINVRTVQAILTLQREAEPMAIVLPFVRRRLQTLALRQGVASVSATAVERRERTSPPFAASVPDGGGSSR